MGTAAPSRILSPARSPASPSPKAKNAAGRRRQVAMMKHESMDAERVTMIGQWALPVGPQRLRECGGTLACLITSLQSPPHAPTGQQQALQQNINSGITLHSSPQSLRRSHLVSTEIAVPRSGPPARWPATSLRSDGIDKELEHHGYRLLHSRGRVGAGVPHRAAGIQHRPG